MARTPSPKELTEENAAYPLTVKRMPRKEAEQRARACLERVELKPELFGALPKKLSGGEQQRVAVARALINHPSVVLADEPSGNLDTENARELHQLFLQLRDQLQQTFVIVTHNPQLSEMADRTLYMEDGLLKS